MQTYGHALSFRTYKIAEIAVKLSAGSDFANRDNAPQRIERLQASRPAVPTEFAAMAQYYALVDDPLIVWPASVSGRIALIKNSGLASGTFFDIWTPGSVPFAHAAALLRGGKPGESIARLNQALALYPAHAESHLLMATVRGVTGDRQSARAARCR